MFSIIVLLFAAVILFIGYMFEQAGIMDEPFNGWTRDSLNTLTGGNEVSIEEDPNFIFGNFGSGLQAVGALMFGAATGGIVQDAFSNLPFWNDAIMLLIRFLYTFSTFWLAIQIALGRGL